MTAGHVNNASDKLVPSTLNAVKTAGIKAQVRDAKVRLCHFCFNGKGDNEA